MAIFAGVVPALLAIPRLHYQAMFSLLNRPSWLLILRDGGFWLRLSPALSALFLTAASWALDPARYKNVLLFATAANLIVLIISFVIGISESDG
jgi:hypothetical protein